MSTRGASRAQRHFETLTLSRRKSLNLHVARYANGSKVTKTGTLTSKAFLAVETSTNNRC